jgi:hypothetical protein
LGSPDITSGSLPPTGGSIDPSVTPTDIETLSSMLTKDKHLLQDGNLNVHDRINYGAATRLCEEHISTFLKKYVPGIAGIPQYRRSYILNPLYTTGSDGMVFFLKLI